MILMRKDKVTAPRPMTVADKRRMIHKLNGHVESLARERDKLEMEKVSGRTWLFEPADLGRQAAAKTAEMVETFRHINRLKGELPENTPEDTWGEVWWANLKRAAAAVYAEDLDVERRAMPSGRSHERRAPQAPKFWRVTLQGAGGLEKVRYWTRPTLSGVESVLKGIAANWRALAIDEITEAEYAAAICGRIHGGAR
jgi:hypothetical protein